MSATPQKTFTVADLNTKGELQLKQTYAYSLLEQIPGSLDLIAHLASNLYRSPDEFETILPLGGQHPINFRWRSSSDTAGIATLRAEGKVVSVSLLVSGVNAETDRLTLDVFQKHLLRELHDTGFGASRFAAR